jgi:hypothetical protein
MIVAFAGTRMQHPVSQGHLLCLDHVATQIPIPKDAMEAHVPLFPFACCHLKFSGTGRVVAILILTPSFSEKFRFVVAAMRSTFCPELLVVKINPRPVRLKVIGLP